MIAFKEWSLICQALADGRQSVILRKGGIAEGKSGFSWKHDEFALFPTHFHEQQKFVKGGGEIHVPEPDLTQHTISLVAKVEWKEMLTDWSKVLALDSFHLWTEDILRERFDYTGDAELSLAVLRVYRLPAPMTFPDARGYGGCRSWVEVPVEETIAECQPVISNEVHQERVKAITQALSPGLGVS